MACKSYCQLFLCLSIVYSSAIAGFWGIHYHQHGSVPQVEAQTIIPFIPDITTLGIESSLSRWHDILIGAFIGLFGVISIAFFDTLPVEETEKKIARRICFIAFNGTMILSTIVAFLFSSSLLIAYGLTVSHFAIACLTSTSLLEYAKHKTTSEDLDLASAILASIMFTGIFSIWAAVPFGIFLGFYGTIQLLLLAVVGLVVLATGCGIFTCLRESFQTPKTSESRC